jgi:hypothetical protein
MNKDLIQMLINILQKLPKEDKTEQKFEALFSEIEKLKECSTKKTDDEFLTINEVCKLIKKGRTTIWSWNKKGLLVPFGKSGKNPIYKKSDVIAFLSQKSITLNQKDND